ncbi:MAG: ATP-dependent DNA helicase RecG [Candidatus Hydrogenedentes bacterium]|nr:ATP-dependent DNA helicase RecG [Candidatus Hydrogenedentota bacterium]
MGNQTRARDLEALSHPPQLHLGDSVDTLPGIGPKRARLLTKLGVTTIRDLLFHFPRDYQDRRQTTSIADAAKGDTVTIQAEVVSARAVRLRGRMSLAEARFKDATGEIKATWFGRGFLARAFTPGLRVLLTGTVESYKGLALKNPDYEFLTGDEDDLLNAGRIVPLYPLTEKISQRMLRRWIRTALDASAHTLMETLPENLRDRYGYPPVHEALQSAHFPDNLEEAPRARERFAYEELLGLQLGVLRERALRHDELLGTRHTTNGPLLEAFSHNLPFKLTGAQQRAIGDILEDMASPRPMARLLQGDVGCGKTAVALHAIVSAADGGLQTALMAPTEVLAAQHHATLEEALSPLGLHVALLTSSTSGARATIHSGDAHIVVGTHALFQEKTLFKNLGLVIFDEQHRFGVIQRGRLAAKGSHPDLLHMTATPIPRSLAMTLYGAMDITVIDELPPGRQPVETRCIAPGAEDQVYAHLLEQAKKGQQSYIVCPLVEDSDRRTARAAVSHFEALSTGPFAELRTALLHGRADTQEKIRVLGAFRTGGIDVLFSTTVIEVGVDAPNATTMVIEDAAQFGLTQLHQLRGRVGRGSVPSKCFLMGKAETEIGRRRLEVMCATTDGFAIAEEDLKLRGPGETYGLRQSGLSDLRVADLVKDIRLLDRARRDAEEILESDPTLASPDCAQLALRAARFAAITR